MKVINVKGFPPVKIPSDGTKLGVEQLKNLIDISLEVRKRLLKIKKLRDANFFKKLFGGWFSFGLFGLQTAWDLIESAPQIASELKDLDWREIEELTLKVAQDHQLNIDAAKLLLDKFKKVAFWLKDGVITLAELKEI